MIRALVVAASAAALVLVACLGEDPAPVSLANGDGGSTPQTCAGDAIEACGASCIKCVAPVGGATGCENGVCTQKCNANETVCGGACVSTLGSSTHCGRCDHACGAAQCTGGKCQAFAVAQGFVSAHAIAVAPSGVVIAADSAVHLCANPDGCAANGSLTSITSGITDLNDVEVSASEVLFDGRIGSAMNLWRCPLSGCSESERTVVESVADHRIGRVVAGPTHLYWTRYDAYYGPYSRRSAPPAYTLLADVRPEVKAGDPYYALASRELAAQRSAVSVGTVSVLWATGGLNDDDSKQLRACALASSCATPAEIATSKGKVSALAYADGKHYVAFPALTGGDGIFSVDDATPSSPTFLVPDANGIVDIAVDDSGIYWVNGKTGDVHHCPNLAGCADSGTPLATGQVGASRIRLDAKFVYWMTPTAVFKVAK